MQFEVSLEDVAFLVIEPRVQGVIASVAAHRPAPQRGQICALFAIVLTARSRCRSRTACVAISTPVLRAYSTVARLRALRVLWSRPHRQLVEGPKRLLRVLPLPPCLPRGQRDEGQTRRTVRRRTRPTAADAGLHAPAQGISAADLESSQGRCARRDRDDRACSWSEGSGRCRELASSQGKRLAKGFKADVTVTRRLRTHNSRSGKRSSDPD